MPFDKYHLETQDLCFSDECQDASFQETALRLALKSQVEMTI